MSKLVYLNNYEKYTDSDDRNTFRAGCLEFHADKKFIDYLTEDNTLDSFLFMSAKDIKDDLEENDNIIRVKAQSGLTQYQDVDHVFSRGRGAIPPSSKVKAPYSVNLLPTFSKASKSMFYAINPFTVESNEVPGEIRTELGIHLDRGVRGSSGCVVIPDFSEFIMITTIFSLLVMQETPQFSLGLEVISSTDFV